MAVWPVGLPASPLIDGFEDKAPDLTIRSSTDTGIDKLRRRYTAGVREQKIPILMTEAQAVTLDEFYEITLGGGTLEFDYTDPLRGVTKSYRFLSPPAFSSKSDKVMTIIEVEQLP